MWNQDKNLRSSTLEKIWEKCKWHVICAILHFLIATVKKQYKTTSEIHFSNTLNFLYLKVVFQHVIGILKLLFVIFLFELDLFLTDHVLYMKLCILMRHHMIFLIHGYIVSVFSNVHCEFTVNTFRISKSFLLSSFCFLFIYLFLIFVTEDLIWLYVCQANMLSLEPCPQSTPEFLTSTWL